MNDKYRFKSKDFYDLLEKQQYCCAYSGRELTPTNTYAVHQVPLAQGGKHNLKNIVLVDKEVYHLKKHISHSELLTLAVDVVKTFGRQEGYNVSKRRK